MPPPIALPPACCLCDRRRSDGDGPTRTHSQATASRIGSEPWAGPPPAAAVAVWPWLQQCSQQPPAPDRRDSHHCKHQAPQARRVTTLRPSDYPPRPPPTATSSRAACRRLPGAPTRGPPAARVGALQHGRREEEEGHGQEAREARKSRAASSRAAAAAAARARGSAEEDAGHPALRLSRCGQDHAFKAHFAAE